MTMLKLSALTLDSTLEGKPLPQSPMKVGMSSDLSFDLKKNFFELCASKTITQQNGARWEGDGSIG